MTKRKFVSSCAFLITLVGLSNASALAQSRAESEVFDLVNHERSRARLGSLAWDDRLGRLARDYSRKMAREGFFDHYDGNGRTVIDRAQNARIDNWAAIGENLFFCDGHPTFTRTAISGWLKSRIHRTNMLDRSWTATGIGVATADDGAIFITQLFTHD